MNLDVFTAPDASNDFSVPEMLVTTEAQGVIEIFLQHHGSTLRKNSRGLADLLERMSVEDLQFDVAWSAEFGSLRRAITDRTIDEMVAAARFGLRAAQVRIVTDWSCTLPEPTNFRLKDRWLRDLRVLEVHSDQQSFDVFSDRGRVGETAVREVDRILLDRVGDVNISFVGPDAVSVLNVPLNGMPLADGPTEEVVQSCREGLHLLRDLPADYLPWIGHVARDIVPLAADEFIRSQSVGDCPGVIAMSAPVRRSAVAEMFIHECSHQYFHILEKLEPLQEPESREMYFSPVKQTERPMSMILLAYHAFANVVLYYQNCLTANLDEREQCVHNIRRHLPELRNMEVGLFASKSLTENARGMFEPLAERLNEIDESTLVY